MNTRVGPGAQLDARAALAAGDADAAVALLQGAVDAGHTRLSVVHDLVRALHRAGRVDDAVLLLQRVVLAAPHRPDLHLQLVRMLHRADRVAEAVVAARRGCDAHPSHHELWLAAESLARTTRRWGDARAAGVRLTELTPDDPHVWRRLAIAARHLDDNDTLLHALNGWVAAAPDNPSARHLHAAHHGVRLERADAAYITALFDSYADRFEAHLAELGYRAPELLAGRVGDLLPAPIRAAADLGCGTGLVGALLRAQVTDLIGVDLSAGMLARACDRGCYDELVEGELTAFLTERSNAFDMVISADSLIYIGNLGPVFAAAAHALRGRGLLAFTIETDSTVTPMGYSLARTGRYVHDPSWIEQQLVAHGFTQVSIEPCVLRLEERREVSGAVVSAFIDQPV